MSIMNPFNPEKLLDEMHPQMLGFRLATTTKR